MDDEIGRRDPKSESGLGDMSSKTKHSEGLGGFKEASQQLPAGDKPTSQGQSEERSVAVPSFVQVQQLKAFSSVDNHTRLRVQPMISQAAMILDFPELEIDGRRA